MTRWHLLRTGRIQATAWSSDGDCATAELKPCMTDIVVSDADWWAMQHRRALRDNASPWATTLRERSEVAANTKRILWARSQRRIRRAEERSKRQALREAKWLSERDAVMERGRLALAKLMAHTKVGA